MNPSLLLHVVERLESVLHKLPEAIQKPVLSEITPLKELFLQQRPPRLLICGSADETLDEIAANLFGPTDSTEGTLSHIHRWQDVHISGRGTIAVLDARGADAAAPVAVREEIEAHAPDVVVFIDERQAGRVKQQRAADSLTNCLEICDRLPRKSTVIGVDLHPAKLARRPENGAAEESVPFNPRVVATFEFAHTAEVERKLFFTFISRHLPNEARVEMIRISGDRAAQHEIAKTLTKSASVICGAIGAQPIPLADLPILTTLQLLMVSGVMYISGRDRSLRAATEFVAALGANVGAGMLLREGARVVLKFIPGWGNVACGMIAAGGTYAMGRAATSYFIDGVSLGDARRTYLTSRRRKAQPAYLENRPQPAPTEVR